jgi:serine protease Do
VTLSFDPQAFLGVQSLVNLRSGDDLPCVIEQVIAGSAADKAGIQIGDVIEEVNGETIKRFDELRMMISQYRVNDTLSLQLLRGGEKLKLDVTLGSIEESPAR